MKQKNFDIPRTTCNICNSSGLLEREKEIVVRRGLRKTFEIVCQDCGNLVFARITQE